MHKVLPSAVVRTRTRNGSIRQRSINKGTATTAPNRTGSRRLGMIVKRKADVSGSMIIRSTKLTVIISLSYLNCDKRMSATTIASDSNPAIAGRRNKASQKKFSSAQASRKVALVASIKLGRDHHDKRGEVQDSDNDQRKRIAARDRLGGRKTTEQGGRCGQHGLRTALPGCDPL